MSNALLTTEKMTRLAMCNTFTSLHITELLTNKLEAIPENIRAKYNIFPSMFLGLNNHSLSTLREQIITWMIAKMKVRKAIITHPYDNNCFRILKTTLWDSEIFPDSAFINLSNANSGSTDFKGLLKLGVPNKRQTTEGNLDAKRHKPNFTYTSQDSNTFPNQFNGPNTSRGSTQSRARGTKRGGRKRCY